MSKPEAVLKFYSNSSFAQQPAHATVSASDRQYAPLNGIVHALHGDEPLSQFWQATDSKQWEQLTQTAAQRPASGPALSCNSKYASEHLPLVHNLRLGGFTDGTLMWLMSHLHSQHASV